MFQNRLDVGFSNYYPPMCASQSIGMGSIMSLSSYYGIVKVGGADGSPLEIHVQRLPTNYRTAVTCIITGRNLQHAQ